MCLFLYENPATGQTHELKIAKEDIVVYKLLREDMKSPFQKFQYELDVLVKNRLERDPHFEFSDGYFYRNNLPYPISFVDDGLHSFVTEEDARLAAEYRAEEVFKAIIPAGSEYYEGEFYYKAIKTYIKAASIASNKLIVKEHIPCKYPDVA